MASEQLCVGIAGTGFIGSVHARSARLAGARVVTVAASSPQSAETAAAELRADRAAASAEELVQDPDIDVVHICTPNHLHQALAAAALAAGKHVVCEKPLAMDASGAELLVAAAQQRVGRARLGDLDVVPADLRLGDAVRLRPGGLGQELASKADTKDRHAALERIAEKGLLRLQPSMLVVLIDMHRPAKHHERVELFSAGRGRRARHPRIEIAKNTRPSVQFVDYREDPHSGVT
jgi:NADPH:quinone reductase-like Zn-dependent oxidoreductase